MYAQPTSIFDRYIARPRPIWIKVTVSLALLVLPFAITYLSGASTEILQNGGWRFFLISPAIMVYIWWIAPLLDRHSIDVIRSIQAITTLDEAEFTALIDKARTVKPRNELIAIGVGVAIGLALNTQNDFSSMSTIFAVYWSISMAGMYGLLAWVVYGSVASIRTGEVLFRQPLHINIFNPTPFEAVGRQSLMNAMAFVGGITISLLLSFQVASLTQPVFWLTYIPLVLITVLIFFMGMQPAHRLLEEHKQYELSGVQRQLERLGQELVARMEQQEPANPVATEINALAAYAQHLQGARTWPYNLGMLRTLFFSVLIPLGSAVAKMAMDILLE